jgi:hypothetical protein
MTFPPCYLQNIFADILNSYSIHNMDAINYLSKKSTIDLSMNFISSLPLEVSGLGRETGVTERGDEGEEIIFTFV